MREVGWGVREEDVKWWSAERGWGVREGGGLERELDRIGWDERFWPTSLVASSFSGEFFKAMAFSMLICNSSFSSIVLLWRGTRGGAWLPSNVADDLGLLLANGKIKSRQGALARIPTKFN